VSLHDAGLEELVQPALRDAPLWTELVDTHPAWVALSAELEAQAAAVLERLVAAPPGGDLQTRLVGELRAYLEIVTAPAVAARAIQTRRARREPADRPARRQR
jgi:hypothetical protein